MKKFYQQKNSKHIIQIKQNYKFNYKRYFVSYNYIKNSHLQS